ncbi:TIGR03084 family metal-binding protein [Rhodococcus sp. HNM0569]|uniref:TIGR03084 family metal-binding protein n=1 Tax=Rhodococcus sp. HNM0569 TaxID=2716340 RepID=UPI00146E91F7|nr:TIGR03084 family metal-binding protein [Rhodococcus sp. HNM0569]NLU82737.1 TIGR03084 family protein [Rhodococcus sp. HNM0569]
MSRLTSVLDDLRAESASLDALVAHLEPAAWATPTPAAGWTVAYQIGHLAWTDEAALVAATDPDAFARELEAAASDPYGFVDRAAEKYARSSPADLLVRWRAGRDALAGALAAVPEGDKVPWYGPPMSPASMATARLMETWAHGLDVADSLGVHRVPTARLKSVAHLGVRTRDFAYAVHGKTPPPNEFRIELTAPDGGVWSWGPADADQRVSGSAEDFCLLVTQRAHRDDLTLHATGSEADEWLSLAQAFAGPPGGGRDPGTR